MDDEINNDKPPEQPATGSQPPGEQQRKLFLSLAAKEGCVAPQDALALAGTLPEALDSSGAPDAVAIAACVRSLKKSRPWLFAPPASPGLTQRLPEGSGSADELRRVAQASGLTRDIQRWREMRRR